VPPAQENARTRPRTRDGVSSSCPNRRWPGSKVSGSKGSGALAYLRVWQVRNVDTPTRAHTGTRYACITLALCVFILDLSRFRNKACQLRINKAHQLRMTHRLTFVHKAQIACTAMDLSRSVGMLCRGGLRSGRIQAMMVATDRTEPTRSQAYGATARATATRSAARNLLHFPPSTTGSNHEHTGITGQHPPYSSHAPTGQPIRPCGRHRMVRSG
jgi:hypothetical protein